MLNMFYGSLGGVPDIDPSDLETSAPTYHPALERQLFSPNPQSQQQHLQPAPVDLQDHGSSGMHPNPTYEPLAPRTPIQPASQQALITPVISDNQVTEKKKVARPAKITTERRLGYSTTADYDSVLLTHPELVTSWRSAPFSYTNAQIMYVLQYFEQVAQIKSRARVNIILTQRKLEDIEANRYDQLDVLDPIVRFTPQNGMPRGVPPIGYVLSEMTDGHRPNIDDSQVNPQMRNGEQNYQLRQYPKHWDCLPIGTTGYQVLQTCPNHTTYEFLDVFLQHKMVYVEVWSHVADPIKAAMRAQKVVVSDQAGNIFKKRMDKRMRILIEKYGYEKVDEFVNSDIKVRELGVAQSALDNVTCNVWNVKKNIDAHWVRWYSTPAGQRELAATRYVSNGQLLTPNTSTPSPDRQISPPTPTPVSSQMVARKELPAVQVRQQVAPQHPTRGIFLASTTFDHLDAHPQSQPLQSSVTPAHVQQVANTRLQNIEAQRLSATLLAEVPGSEYARPTAPYPTKGDEWSKAGLAGDFSEQGNLRSNTKKRRVDEVDNNGDQVTLKSKRARQFLTSETEAEETKYAALLSGFDDLVDFSAGETAITPTTVSAPRTHLNLLLQPLNETQVTLNQDANLINLSAQADSVPAEDALPNVLTNDPTLTPSAVVDQNFEFSNFGAIEASIWNTTQSIDFSAFDSMFTNNTDFGRDGIGGGNGVDGEFGDDMI